MNKRILCMLFSFIMLLSAVIPCVSAAEEQGIYQDVSVEQWFYQSVVYCSEMGMMKGIGGQTFAPDTAVNRAMFVTILHRLAGSTDVGASTFTDVPDGCYYENAVAWAQQLGIVKGTTESTFSPNNPITRQDMACMIARYVIAIDADALADDGKSPVFSDAASISPYAKEAVDLMCRMGLFVGDPANNFRPKATGTRAEAATIFTRLALLLEKIPCQATLETITGTYTLSTADTIAFYRAVSGLKLQSGAYPEYVATHTVKLWNGTYRFNFSNEFFYPGFGYQYADCYAGCPDGGDAVTQTVYPLLNAYTN